MRYLTQTPEEFNAWVRKTQEEADAYEWVRNDYVTAISLRGLAVLLRIERGEELGKSLLQRFEQS